MKKFKKLLVLIILSFFLGCFSQCSAQKPKSILRAIKLTFNLPAVAIQNPEDTVLTLENITDSVFAFFVEDKVVYKLPVIHIVQFGDSVASRVIKYNYFAYLKDAVDGLLFDSLQVTVGKKINVHQLLKERAFGTFKVVLTDDSLVETTKLPQRGLLIEKYTSHTKGMTYPDTTLLYYTNTLKGIKYSLSDSLDRIKGQSQKLFKVRYVFNSQLYDESPFRFPQREISFEISEIPVTKEIEKEISSIVNKMEN